MNNKLYVTRPYLPPLDELLPYLNSIWESRELTNGGQFHRELEERLKIYLGVSEISLFSNGTLALIMALKALNITGEVITTPFTFVATSHSLLWNYIDPVFVDISSETFNIDPSKISEAITDKTSAILGVHCYGTPCDNRRIEEIAKSYKLKVIYDAAHAFGVRDNTGSSILNYGDLSVLSFHATKVFNTFEGGAIISHSKDIKEQIDNLKNFGFESEIAITGLGLNGKMSEINSALGILQLSYVEECIAARKTIDSCYRRNLTGLKGVMCPEINSFHPNYSYFPILIEEICRIDRDTLYEKLKEKNIYARRYFFPLISNLEIYRGYPSAAPSNLPIANRIANQVLCLPIYPELSIENVNEISNVIRDLVA